MPEELGDIIRRLREERSMSQIGLAWAANIKAATLNNYESGHRKPDFEVLTAIADALDVSLDVFRVGRRRPNKELTDEMKGVLKWLITRPLPRTSPRRRPFCSAP